MSISIKILLFVFIILTLLLSTLGVYKLSLVAWQVVTFDKEPATIISCKAKMGCHSSKTRIEHCYHHYYPVAQTKNLTTIVGRTGISEASCKNQINHTVNVLINPNKPSENTIYTLMQFWFLPLIILTFLLFIFTFVIILFRYKKIA